MSELVNKFVAVMSDRANTAGSPFQQVLGMRTPTIVALAADLLDEIRLSTAIADERSVLKHTADVANLMVAIASLSGGLVRPGARTSDMDTAEEYHARIHVLGKSFDLVFKNDGRLTSNQFYEISHAVYDRLSSCSRALVISVWDQVRAPDGTVPPSTFLVGAIVNSLLKLPEYSQEALKDLPLDRFRLLAL